MRERILGGWTVQRALFLIIGCAICYQSMIEKRWFLLAFGIYFASMGVFQFGCAAGNCYATPKNAMPSNNATDKSIEETTFEEIK